MTRDKDLIQKLFKIAEKQQQIITKLAQQLEPQPLHVAPKHPELHPAQAVLNALPPNVAASLDNLVATRDVLEAYFKPGMASQQSLDAIVRTVQQLLSKGKLPFAYKVRHVG